MCHSPWKAPIQGTGAQHVLLVLSFCTVDLLVAGGAAEVLLVSLNFPLPLLRTHSPALLVCCFFVFAEMGAISTASGQLEVNLLLSVKQDGKSHFGTTLVSAVSGI